MQLILFPANVHAIAEQEMETWTYHKEWDNLNNLNFSFVRSPMPKRGLYDNIRLEILCKNNKLQLVAESSSLITSQDREFEVEYQIDKQLPVIIKLRTFRDNKRRGYSDIQIDRIIRELLSGESIFIRINTIISTVLSANITLKDAAEPLSRVLADCGIVRDKTSVQQVYSLAEFERDFAKLTPEQQGQALNEIKKIMEGIR
ncbi:MAG: hypothetical protein HOP23_03600 [Methylococcaceae bacterium]|nr:hypothetical protein [Methylococcaceae bacterium]